MHERDMDPGIVAREVKAGRLVRVKRFSERAVLPTRAHDNDAGMDLYAANDTVLFPGMFVVIDTDIGLELPEGTYGQILGRSSLAVRGVFTMGGVIDAGYRGPIKVALGNQSGAAIQVKAGDKVAQLVIINIQTPRPIEVEELPPAERGDKGFGSSGR
jgi:dUTP pyrophosphatase